LEGLIIGEADDRRNGFEERLVDVDIRLGIDGVVGKVEELDDPRLLIGLFEEAIAS